MTEHVICSVDKLPPGQRKIVEIAGKSIGVFNLAGRGSIAQSVPKNPPPGRKIGAEM